MKTIISYLLFLVVNMCSFDVPQISDIERIIRKNNPMWVDSWVHDPLRNLSFDSCWYPNDAYSWDYSKDDPIYECFYNYSPSKTRLVDIYARHLDVDIIKNDTVIKDVYMNKNDTVIMYGQHESEIIFLDTIAKTSGRLLYVSYGMYFEDVIWITDNIFIVLGHSYEHDYNYIYDYSKLISLVIIFDLNRKKHLCCFGTINERKYDYIEKKFKERNINLIE